MNNTTKTQHSFNAFQILGIRLRQHPWVATGLFLLVFAGLGLIYSAYRHLTIGAQHKTINSLSTVYSTNQASLINSFIDTELSKFSAFMERPLAISALQSGDKQRLEKAEALLGTLSPHMVKGMILTTQDSRLYEGENYAALELVKQAKISGIPPSPEAVKINNQWIILLVLPVFSATDISLADTASDVDSSANLHNTYLGAMVAELGLEKLQAQLSNKKFAGQTQLIQQIEGIPPQQIITTGLSPDLSIQASKPTHFPHWTITFKANSAILEEAPVDMNFVYLIIGCVLGVFVVIIYSVIRIILGRYQNEPLELKIKSKNKRHGKTQDDIQADIDSTESYLVSIPSAEYGAANIAENPVSTTENLAQNVASNPKGDPYPKSVFREYDIRGIVNSQITTQFATQLGKAIGTMAIDRGETALVSAMDGRLSSPKLYSALEQGILSTGCNILHIGAVPTPVLNYAIQTRKETESGVMVTASHNPSDYNGFKVCLNNQTASKEDILKLYNLMINNQFRQGEGNQKTIEIEDQYITAVREDVVPGYGLKVVIDTGNGIAGEIAPKLIEELGCQVFPLFCSVDGSFPNHSPDTSKEANLQSLIETVKQQQADLGIALDGDGDRIVAVAPSGRIIWPDELLMIFARDVLSRQPGADIVFDVKSTHRLNNLISSYGGRPVIWKTGHSNMRSKTLSCDAPLGGEYSGHIFFRDRWFGFDDGIYAAARLIEVISTREQSLDEIVSTFETSYATNEITIDFADDEKFQVMEIIQQNCEFDSANITTLDGLRVDYPKAWGLIRASNTSPALTLRFEASTPEDLEKIQSLFKEQLRNIDDRLTF